VKLRYFDSAPEHCGLWPQISPDFVSIPSTFSQPQDREARIELFFKEKLPSYAGEMPLLLVYHINECNQKGEIYSLTQEQVKRWVSAEKIFTLFVTGGEPSVARELKLQASFPDSHFHVYPRSLSDIGKGWSNLQLQAWKTFLFTFQNSGIAQWSLLDSLNYTESRIRSHLTSLLNPTSEIVAREHHALAMLQAQMSYANLESHWQNCQKLIKAEPPLSQTVKKQLNDLFFGDDQGLEPGIFSELSQFYSSRE